MELLASDPRCPPQLDGSRRPRRPAAPVLPLPVLAHDRHAQCRRPLLRSALCPGSHKLLAGLLALAGPAVRDGHCRRRHVRLLQLARRPPIRDRPAVLHVPGLDAQVQTLLYDILTSPAARRYIDQTHDGLPASLGAARGKIVLIRRFLLDQLPSTYDAAALPGVGLVPSSWPDNSPDFSITYNAASNLTAYVEDLYEPDADGLQGSVSQKTDAVVSHLAKAAAAAAATSQADLFITFASSEHNADVPPEYPETMATGNGTVTGVNERLLQDLQNLRGKRLGVVVLDFFDWPPNLVESILML